MSHQISRTGKVPKAGLNHEFGQPETGEAHCPSSDNLEHQSGFVIGCSDLFLIKFMRFQFDEGMSRLLLKL